MNNPADDDDEYDEDAADDDDDNLTLKAGRNEQPGKTSTCI